MDKPTKETKAAEISVGSSRPQPDPAERLSTALVVPTLNAGSDFIFWLTALREQTMRPDRLLLVDSSSDDNTPAMAREFGFDVQSIGREEFSHGGTRQSCVDQLNGSDVIIFLTQDALLAKPEALERLLKWFDDPKVGAAYGRQLPRQGAGPIEAHARLFNYPDESRVKSLEDIPQLGLKTPFISNSFAAYRRSVLQDIGGFSSSAILSEDTQAASSMILEGWKLVYAADAAVYHSHAFSWLQEFRRYFDVGVFHAREPWIREKFGQAEGEGGRFVRSELEYLKATKPTAIPSALVRTVLKLCGYRLGANEKFLPRSLKTIMSTNRAYWSRGGAGAEKKVTS